MYKNQKSKKILSIAVIFMVLFFTFYPPLHSQATVLSTLSDQMTRMADATLSSHDITLKLSVANTFAAGETITIDFNEGGGFFTVDAANSVIADFDFNDGTERTVIDVDVDAPVCVEGVNNVAIGIVEATGVVTIEACATYAASDPNATINIEYGTVAGGTNRVTNGAVATRLIGVDETTDDAATIAVVIIDDDQIVYTATVDPSLTVSFNDNASGFDQNLSPSVVGSAVDEIQITIGTNGTNGMTARVYDSGCGTAKPGLAAAGCAADADVIGSNTSDYGEGGGNVLVTLGAGTEGYGINAQDGGVGTGDVPLTMGTRYDHATDVGALEVGADTAQTLASCDDPIDDARIDINAKAAVDNLVKAGVYTDTVTIVVTGNF